MKEDEYTIKIRDVNCNKFTHEQWYKIAVRIDNNYIGSFDTFEVEDKKNYYYITTNKCDDACLIKVFYNSLGISEIKVLGEYTNGWSEIQFGTYDVLKDII